MTCSALPDARCCCCSIAHALQAVNIVTCIAWHIKTTLNADLHSGLSKPAGLVEFEGEEYMTEPDAEVEELIDSMSTAFYSLAATGTVRVGRMCKGPQLLACWALELLEEQACHVSHPAQPCSVLCCAALQWAELCAMSRSLLQLHGGLDRLT